ncbi:MAG: esterase [Acidobacteria bacterium]|nr:esterase [Acidobacteriota bacterium]MCB9396998.1 esterase [Acidobacteriota bacterium]
MHRRHEILPNAAMGRKMHVWCFGHFGMPLLVFPTAAGFAHEWDRQSMITTLAPLILSGKIKVYCPESNVAETWTSKTNSGEKRMERHRAYEDFIVNTLVPFIRADCRSNAIPIAVTGASLGGFYAANFALKFPDLFNYALCMSGRYNLSHFMGSFQSGDVYFNNPLAYVVNLHGEFLERVQKNTHLTLVCGQGPYEEGCIEETIALADLLLAKGIPHYKDIWGREVAHDWGWWKKQALMHLTHRFQ